MAERERDSSNLAAVTVIFTKTVIGAGVAALPLTNITLGWPLATACLLLIGLMTKWSLDLITRAGERCKSMVYVDITEQTLGRGWAVLLEVAIILFSLGLMLVYSVVLGDMLVGKLNDGLICDAVGGIACWRPFVVAIATLLVLFPLISFRKVESLAFAGWTGVGALLIWAVATLLLVIVALARGKAKPINLGPSPGDRGGSRIAMFTNCCSVISTLTTAFSCQAAGMYALKDLKPQTIQKKGTVTTLGISVTSGIYILISIGSCLLFGAAVDADVLQNFTVDGLSSLVPNWLGWLLYVVVRLSFLLGVVTLYPLMMFPARDGLVKFVARRKEPLPFSAHICVTYAICTVLFLLSIFTPSIQAPIQVIGATAGAVIGFIIPGLLAFRKMPPAEVEPLLTEEQENTTPPKPSHSTSVLGSLLVLIGVLQCITGIAAQAFSRHG